MMRPFPMDATARRLALFVLAASVIAGVLAGGCAKPNFDTDPEPDPLPERSDSSTPDPASPDAEPEVEDAARGDAPADADAGPDPCGSPDLVGCFTFEGAVDDRSSTKLAPAVAIGVAFGAGKTGQGLAVGPTTELRFAAAPAYAQASVTAEAFINITQLPTSEQVIFDADGRFAMLLEPDGSIRCNVTPTAVSGGVVTAGRWVHVACVIGAGKASVYVDGILVKQGGGQPGPGPGQEAIGGDAPGGGQRFAGGLDTLRIFKVARSTAEIALDSQ